ncbi:MAG TPA: hypothetical protein VFP61_03225, partial [Acidimicrobiales bacterium]|nr:hypothetical protein [Acidimicrobiales bacterium]
MSPSCEATAPATEVTGAATGVSGPVTTCSDGATVVVDVVVGAVEVADVVVDPAGQETGTVAPSRSIEVHEPTVAAAGPAPIEVDPPPLATVTGPA